MKFKLPFNIRIGESAFRFGSFKFFKYLFGNRFTPVNHSGNIADCYGFLPGLIGKESTVVEGLLVKLPFMIMVQANLNFTNCSFKVC
jgi:hypothetical protein